MKVPSTVFEPEFSHIVLVDKIPALGMDLKVEAQDAQCVRLAKRFDLKELSKLYAILSLKPAYAGEAIHVTGRFIADVVQSCVITLEPFPTHIEHDVNVLFVRPAQLDDFTQSVPLDSEQDIETIVNGGLDLGEILAQHLGIMLDPYPRKPDASLQTDVLATDNSHTKPFAKLLDLKKKPRNS